MQGWETVKLADICNVNYGESPARILSDEGNIPVIGTGGTERLGTDFLYEGESIIIGRKGTIDNPLYVNGKFWSIDTTYYLTNFQDIDVKWLFYFLKTIDFNLLNEATGVPSLSREALYRIKIRKPKLLPEQTAIARILSTVDKAVEQNEWLIAKYQRMKTGLMQDLLTRGIDEHGRIRSETIHRFKDSPMGRIPEEWEVKEVGQVTSITTGSKDTQNKIDDGDYPFFVRSQTVERINSFSFDGEAVLTSGDGVGVGKIYHYINGKFDFHQRVYMMYNFKADELDGKYFFQFFRNNFFNEVSKYSAKTTVDSVRMEMISKMLIPLPPIKEQVRIARILFEHEQFLEQEIYHLTKLHYLKTGLMQDLLSGRVRVPSDMIGRIGEAGEAKTA